MSSKQKAAVIYLRVSSSGQMDKARDPEGYSIPAQREACQRYADQLGATVIAEYVESGKSGTSTKRPALQKMLSELAGLHPDYVIFYDLSRVARDDFDALWLLREIEQHGCKLESTLERVDDSPAGRLLYTIMAGVNAFRSRGDAVKVKAGLERKHETGGTPFRAPIGYINTREVIDGREVRVVTLDPKRARFVRLAFSLYATGDYALSDLAPILAARGLRTRPTRSAKEAPLGINRIGQMLRNDYYCGFVHFNGKTTKGEHEPLIDEKTFQHVQELLDAQRKSGERSWRNYHYLRGSIYCDECKGRLFFTRVRGRTGRYYDYFVCRGRQTHTCSQPNHRVGAVEEAVVEKYRRIQLTPSERRLARSAIQIHVDKIRDEAEGKLKSAENGLTVLEAQEQKLLAAHYEDHISDTLFFKESERIKRERAEAEALIEQFEIPFTQALKSLDEALELTKDIQGAYAAAEDSVRRLFNQAFFARLYVRSEDVSDDEPTEIFGRIGFLAHSEEAAAVQALLERPVGPPEAAQGADEAVVAAGQGGPENARNSSPVAGLGVSYLEAMVRAEGFEPPRAEAHQDLNLARLPNSATPAWPPRSGLNVRPMPQRR
jgi:site-specific DNA recombinase